MFIGKYFHKLKLIDVIFLLLMLVVGLAFGNMYKAIFEGFNEPIYSTDILRNQV